MIPDRVPGRVHGRRESRWKRRALELRAKCRNLQTSVDAFADELIDAEALCGALAAALQELDPDFVSKLSAEDQEIWDYLQPFGSVEGG